MYQRIVHFPGRLRAYEADFDDLVGTERDGPIAYGWHEVWGWCDRTIHDRIISIKRAVMDDFGNLVGTKYGGYHQAHDPPYQDYGQH